jgi:myo-inositol-1(or 4)-monophosphatase
VAELLSGYKTVTHTDIMGTLKSIITGSNDNLKYIYYPGEYEWKKAEYERAQVEISTGKHMSREEKEEISALKEWLNGYTGFGERYSLGESSVPIGKFWESFIAESDIDAVYQVAETMQLIHDEFMPFAKQEVLKWIENLEDYLIIDPGEIDVEYRRVRKIQLERIRILKREKIRQVSGDFFWTVTDVTRGKMKLDIFEYPHKWCRKEFDYLCKAVKFASRAHEGATRKGTDIPYIMHPIEAGLIVMTLSEDPDVAVAAILHDVVEDTDYSAADIAGKFGDRVADLVAHESEDKMRHMSPEDSWKLRKEAFIENLKEAPPEAKIICLADKLSNMRLSAKVHKKKGDAMWLDFNQKDKREQEWYYRSIYENIPELAGTEAYKEYVKLCDKVFA